MAISSHSRGNSIPSMTIWPPKFGSSFDRTARHDPTLMAWVRHVCRCSKGKTRTAERGNGQE